MEPNGNINLRNNIAPRCKSQLSSRTTKANQSLYQTQNILNKVFTRDPVQLKFIKDEQKLTVKKISTAKQISNLNQNLNKILKPIAHKQSFKINPKSYYEITMAQYQQYYFQLCVMKQQPPIKLHIKKLQPHKDTQLSPNGNLIIYFSKNRQFPDIDSYDLKYDEEALQFQINHQNQTKTQEEYGENQQKQQNNQASVNSNMKIVLNDERLGLYMQESFYLTIISSCPTKILIAYSFGKNVPNAGSQKQYQIINTEFLNNPTFNDGPMTSRQGQQSMMFSTFQNGFASDQGFKTSRVIPRHQKNYVEMKKQVNELIHDFGAYRTFMESINKIQEDRFMKSRNSKKRFQSIESARNQSPQIDLQSKDNNNMQFLSTFSTRQQSRESLLPQSQYQSQTILEKFKHRRALINKDNNEEENRKKKIFLLHLAAFMSIQIQESRAKDSMIQFFRGLKSRELRMTKFRRFYLNIVSIQKRFRSHMKKVELRLKVLSKLWEHELQQMIMALIQKPKNKKNQALLERLQSLDKRTREMVLNKYFNKCYLSYNAAFFKWHESYVLHSKGTKHLKYIKVFQQMTQEENMMVDQNMEHEAMLELQDAFRDNKNQKLDKESKLGGIARQSTRQRIENLEIIDFKMNTFVPQNHQDAKSKQNQENKILNKVLITEVDFDKFQENLAINQKKQKDLQISQSSKRIVSQTIKKQPSNDKVSATDTKQFNSSLHDQISKMHGQTHLDNNNSWQLMSNPLDLYEEQLRDMSEAPKLIYLPSKLLIQRMILRACFLRISMTMKFGYNKNRKSSYIKDEEF
eukprot:403352539